MMLSHREHIHLKGFEYFYLFTLFLAFRREVRFYMNYDLSKKSDEELIKLLHTKLPTGDLYIAAKIEYEKRLGKRTFWRKDIVAWLAFGVSIISLVVSIIALYIKRH